MDAVSLRRARASLLAVVALAGLMFVTGPGRMPAKEVTPPADAALVKAAAAVYADVRVVTLPNGLQVVLKPVKSSPVVTTMVAYRVGSADENLDHTGLAHYLEHLMFKGTDILKPGDIDRMTQRNGGSNNAYTTEDFTVFHFDFAADRYYLALQVEADRMQNLRVDSKHEFQKEKGAVIQELKRDEDEPWDLDMKTILPLLFGKKAPYGHPVIGEEDQVQSATAQVIKGYYDKWYHPNNAVLVICGGFDPDEALARVKKLFGPIPAAKLPPRRTVPPYSRSGPVHKEFASKFDVPRMTIGFNGVKSGAKDFYALEVIQELLSGGKTSRLYKRLVEKEQVANAVSASNNAGRYPGWFSIQVEFLQGKDPARGEQLVLEELKKLQTEKVSAADLQHVRRRMLAGTIFGRESVHDLADSIARGMMTNNLDFLKNYLANIEAVTADDIQNAARKYLDPEQRVVVVSMPSKENKAQGKALGTHYAAGRLAARRACLASPTPVGAGNFSLKNAERVVLDNGLTLLLLENHRLPIVVARAMVREVTLREPGEKAGVAALMGMLLDEGTDKHTGPEIAALIEDVGGALEMSSSGGAVKVLTPNRDLGLGLLFECLSRANFPKEQFALQRERLLSAIDDARKQPEQRAQQVYRALVYGKHPYGRPALGTRKTVEPLTPADCLAFYHQVFVPNNTVVAIVGDFDRRQVIDEVKRLTADWKPGSLAKLELPPIPRQKEFVQKILTMPQAAQLHFFMGHVGIRRTNKDFYKLLIMDNVLGTGPGFTDRLSSRLRDRLGLAYTVSATITSSAGLEPGLFTCYIGTAPRFFQQVKKAFLEEVRRIRTEPPRKQEVEDAQKYLLGRLPFRLTTSELVAAQMLAIEEFHLGWDYLEHYRQAVAAVTPAQVREVAAKYLDPDHMVLVAAGAIDQKGQPLEKVPSPKGKEKE